MNYSGEHSIIIRGTGAYIPQKVLTNNELSCSVEASDEWIRSRTGILERRIAADKEYTSHMAVAAAKKAIEKAEICKEAIDLIIIGTMTPDMLCPPTATLVQSQLGLKSIPCFDIAAACSGYIYIQEVAASLLQTSHYQNALIVGAEKMSSIIDWQDRTTCVLFGDGAGAAVLSEVPIANTGILGSLIGADGENFHILQAPGCGTTWPPSLSSIQEKKHFLKMNGKEVFKFAIRIMEQICWDLLKQHNLKPSDIDYIIPHQANIRIIEGLAERLKVPLDRFVCNLPTVGNTSAASIPIALDEALEGGKIQSGDLILMVAFGGGLMWGASLIKWHQ